MKTSEIQWEHSQASAFVDAEPVAITMAMRHFTFRGNLVRGIQECCGLSLQLFCKSKIIPEYKVYFRKSGPECTFLFG